ncbi:MAG: 16S rRNA (adenine(1518)-N(6)/adenine(1519)-N(6))-dimethyltransferase RsmA [Candidatus Colwellbacteria bacterium]|nr:16S rRNA (adenine(1518)-N(6)/adenine(1519)-N(6))-dimethyltransferase RsmA [Candidatus Colwellbacteria bacterium]
MPANRAKKSLGQNFLKDHKVLERIAEVLEIKEGDTVVEIGPGHGELTRRILKYSPKKLIAIEKDSELIESFLQELIDEYPNLEVVQADALREIPQINYPYKLVGNIPYYITGHLLRLIQETEHKPSVIVLTLQKEVANRLCAKPPEMNLLAASIQFWAKPEIIRYISKKSFRPAPKVDSAVVKIAPLDPQPSIDKSQTYYPFIKALFKQPRKTVLNNLRSMGITKDALEKLGFDPKIRPQNLYVQDIKKLRSMFIKELC